MSASPELILMMVGMMLNFPAWKKKSHEVTPERTTHKTRSRMWYYTGEAAALPDVFCSQAREWGICSEHFQRLKVCVSQI